MTLQIKVVRKDFQEVELLIDEKIANIAAALIRGDSVPAIVVRFDGESYWLQDGFHRIAAAEWIGREEIEAEVIPGGPADIQTEFDRMIREMRDKW